MKHCPQCFADFDDKVSFCPNDGRSLVEKTARHARLCPNCANSIADDAVRCPYCKAELDRATAPQWPKRDPVSIESESSERRGKIPALSKTVIAGAIVLCALLLVFIVAGNFIAQGNRSVSRAMLEAKIQELEEKEKRIKELEAQLAQTREEAGQGSRQIAALKAKLDETEKQLSASQQRLSTATRETTRVTAARPSPSPAVQKRQTEPAPAPEPRRPAEPGIYETVRDSPVHQEPSGASRVIAQIGKGSKVTVVRSAGDWLEVRSKHGNPPGFIRVDDAVYVSRN